MTENPQPIDWNLVLEKGYIDRGGSYVYIVPNQDAIAGYMRAIVHSTLTNTPNIRQNIEHYVPKDATFGKQQIARALVSAPLNYSTTHNEEAIAEAEEQAYLAAGAAADGESYGVDYDHWLGQYPIKGSIHMQKIEDHDSESYFISAPISRLGEIKGFPRQLIYKATAVEPTGSHSSFQKISLALNTLGIDDKNIESEFLRGRSLLEHFGSILEHGRFYNILEEHGKDLESRMLLMHPNDYIEEKVRIVYEHLSDEEKASLEQSVLNKRLSGSFGINLFSGDQKGELSFMIGLKGVKVSFDPETMKLKGDLNEATSAFVQAYLHPRINEKSTHEDLFLVREKGIKALREMGIFESV